MSTRKLPFVVGLTGGIGAGKSAAAAAFQALGIEVIDADAISREIVAPGSATLQEIAAHFGDQLLKADNSLDRALLRDLIFSSVDAKQWLDQLLHPRIRARINTLVQQSSAPWLLLMVPLLLEAQGFNNVNRILVVDVPEALQIERASRRDSVSNAQIQSIMNEQLGRKQRLQSADDVLDNSGTLAELNAQVASLAQHYKELADDRHKAD